MRRIKQVCSECDGVGEVAIFQRFSGASEHYVSRWVECHVCQGGRVTLKVVEPGSKQ